MAAGKDKGGVWKELGSEGSGGPTCRLLLLHFSLLPWAHVRKVEIEAWMSQCLSSKDLRDAGV